MSEEEEKIRKAMSVMGKTAPEKASPTDTIDMIIQQCRDDGYNVCGIAFGERAFSVFARDLERQAPKKLKLVDAKGDAIGSDKIKDVKMYKGIKVYKKSTEGFEPLFQ